MTYQKSFLHLLAVTMVFSLGALFSACGSDDDKNEVDNGKGFYEWYGSCSDEFFNRPELQLFHQWKQTRYGSQTSEY
jgi:hypothetical protein